MAWKNVTNGESKYFINLDEVAYLHENSKGSVIVFSNGAASLSVDQKPFEILKGEDVT